MGFSIAWLAFRGISPQAALARLVLADTGEADEWSESAVSGATIPAGWFVVQLRDAFHPFVGHEALAGLSAGCEILGCQVEDHSMVSAAFRWLDGAQMWSISHDAENGVFDLSVVGSPPAELDPIRSRLMAEQEAEGGEEADVDVIHDLPIQIAALITGYRHDQRGDVASGRPFRARYAFTKLVALNS